MVWQTPIIDRTQEDIKKGSAKGYCNAVDLTRLEQNSQIVAELLGLTLVAGRPWDSSRMPTQRELGRITENISFMRGRYTPYQTTPAAPESPLNHWKKWNDAEQILQDSRQNALANRAARDNTGELFGGDRIGVI